MRHACKVAVALVMARTNVMAHAASGNDHADCEQ
jgi:hypothetical protein